MSLRQFYPKRNSRKGLSTWKLFSLYSLLLIAIGLQISYPLIDGEALRVVTIATVYWAAAAMLLHAAFAYGSMYAFLLLIITFLYALARATRSVNDNRWLMETRRLSLRW